MGPETSHVHKITYRPLIGMALYVMCLMGGKSITWAMRVETFMAQPFQWPKKWIYPHQNHYVQGRINNTSIGDFMYMGPK